MSLGLGTTELVNLGRYIPDKTPLSQPCFCALENSLGLVTLPFVVYGEEQANGLKPGYFVSLDGSVTRNLLDGLTPHATVFAFEKKLRTFFAWTDANRSKLVGVRDTGRVLFQLQIAPHSCGRQSADGRVSIGAPQNILRRYDAAGTLLHDYDAIFRNRPFPGPHGIDNVGSHTYLADPIDTHSVWVIDGGGNPMRRIGSTDGAVNRSNQGLLYYPFDVVVLASDLVVVSEEGRKRLSVFDSGGLPMLHLEAKDLGVDEIDTTRVFTTWDRGSVALIGRLNKEVHLIVFDLIDGQ